MAMPSIIDEGVDQINGARDQSSTPKSWNRRPLEQVHEVPKRNRSRLVLWLAIAGIAGAGGWAFYDMYPRVNSHGESLGKLTALPVLWDNLAGRVSGIEQKLTAIPAEVSSLRERLGAADQRLLTGLAAVKQNVANAGAALRKDLLAANARQANTDARVTSLETSQQTEAARTSALEQRLERRNAQLERQVAELTERLAAAGQNTQPGARQIRQQLEEQKLESERRLAQATASLERPRTRFEAARGSSVEVVPGILLHVTKTDVAHRRFSGWLQLVESGKTLWLRNEGALRSVAFRAGPKILRHELVITDLTQDGVTGYVIFPSRAESGDATL